MIANALFALLLVGQVATQEAPKPITVDALLAGAKTHDTKVVTVDGVVSDYRERTSRAGNDYTTFKIKGTAEEAAVNVYTRSHPEPAPGNGDTVRLNGIFRIEKQVQNFTVKNEVEVTKVEGKPYGIKILKKAEDG